MQLIITQLLHSKATRRGRTDRDRHIRFAFGEVHNPWQSHDLHIQIGMILHNARADLRQ